MWIGISSKTSLWNPWLQKMDNEWKVEWQQKTHGWFTMDMWKISSSESQTTVTRQYQKIDYADGFCNKP